MKNNYLSLKNFVVCIMISTFGMHVNAQTDYSVTSIPHQVYTAAVPVQFTSDDKYSDVIPLTFDFTFMGNTFNQVLIGTNGDIRFDTALANG